MVFKKFGRLLIECLKKLDLFPTTQFIKFNKQSQYTTATGGFVSLGLIIIILILFSSKGIQTLNRSIINSSTSQKIDTEPSPLSVVTSPSGGFMFAIGLSGINLNDPSLTYFDITLQQDNFIYFNQPKNTQVPLVRCTSDHFAFNQDILDLYYKIDLGQFLCPPLGYQFEVRGRFTSQIYSQFSINIQKCNSTVNPTCANDSKISSMGTFTFAVPFVNTIVNPADQTFKQTFIQDRNYFTFSPTFGIQVRAEIAKFQIDTDTSIMPYTQTVTEYITTIPYLMNSRVSQVVDNLYASVSFSKSSTTTTYTRSFNKLDDYLSYVGGLIGSALVLFFMLKSYSERSYLLQVASKMLLNENTQFSLKKFNFLENIGVVFKKICNAVYIEINWRKGDFMIRSMEEIQQQLDICLLIKRIAFLEEAVSSILSQHQLDALYLKDKRSLQVIQKWRQKHKIANSVSHHRNNQERTDLQLKEHELMSQDLSQGQSKQLFDKLKINLEKVAYESKHKDVISRRIIEKIDSATLEKLGINQNQQPHYEYVSLEQVKSRDKQIQSSRNQKSSKNAVGNDYEKPKNHEKQDFVFQYSQHQS